MTSPAEIAWDAALAPAAGRRTAADVRDREEREAFQRLVETHAPRMRAVARRLAPAQDADDVLQDTFTRAWRRLASFRREADVRTWLYRILVNVCRDRHRRTARALNARSPRRPPADPAGQAQRRELVERVLRAIDALPLRQRECLLLRAQGGLDYREIASALGIRRGSVKSHLVHARRTLLARFGGDLKGIVKR